MITVDGKTIMNEQKQMAKSENGRLKQVIAI